MHLGSEKYEIHVTLQRELIRGEFCRYIHIKCFKIEIYALPCPLGPVYPLVSTQKERLLMVSVGECFSLILIHYHYFIFFLVP